MPSTLLFFQLNEWLTFLPPDCVEASVMGLNLDIHLMLWGPNDAHADPFSRFYSYDVTSKLREITVPVLVLYGAEGELMPPGQSHKFCIRNCQWQN
jgi:pimeloyl-ACP methyl ester carboxylesterase